MRYDITERLDPELRPVFKKILAQPAMSFDDLPAARLASREMWAKVKMPPLPGIKAEDKKVPGPEGAPDVPVRLYRPEKTAGPLPAILWIHGGGYIVGDIDQEDYASRQMALAADCAVVSVAYRLAPEHPYPAPLEDCYAALKWLHGSVKNLGLDASRIAVGGASAGGGLAAGLALLARDRREVKVCFQLLVYPMLDDTNVAPASDVVPDTIFWTRANNLLGWRSYLGCEQGSKDVACYASACRAADLKGLPPAYICVGDLDLFAQEDIEYGRRLAAAGVATELHVYPGGSHGFDMLVPGAEISRRFTADLRRALKQALHG